MKRLGDACGGFIAADEDTKVFSELQWVCLLVCVDGKNFPYEMFIKIEEKSWKIQLWWELPPISDDLPMRNSLVLSKVGQRGEGDETTHAAKCVSKGLGGITVEMAKEQVWGSVSKVLTPTMKVTFGSHSTSEADRIMDSNGFGKMGLDLLAPTHKEAFLEKPISQETE